MRSDSEALRLGSGSCDDRKKQLSGPAVILRVLSSLFRWIDLCKVKDVRKASSETQDKNNLTFEVETEGRVYELLAENGPDMEK